ncbi:hypothetical protein F960_02497 [Acinetobacter gerneri DSM 14967 = CIP 107464 = MTCC 9824]|jgi:uncharacterized protein YpiB (UPF0302 family)|uniref:DUF1090 domain-containing protein n=2 Tax=Acinetobacter gerneri TaxID=202952 RepID=N8ZI92_9GAMM|nr:hypothetical protein F960_02497 [Acinetobacter gerneri DSM 14967 = CIP 107464 = MTCC 9824]
MKYTFRAQVKIMIYIAFLDIIMMFTRILLTLSVALISVNSFAYDAHSCKIKREKLVQQLHYAKQYNNTQRIKGLERALARLDQKCAVYVAK